MTSETVTDADRRKRRYHRLIRMIAHNTGDPQPVLVAGRPLYTTVGHSNIDGQTARRVMERAIENGHVLRWVDAEGTNRYGVTTAGLAETPRIDAPLYGPADREGLERVIETEVAREDPATEVVGWANQRLAALEESEE